VRRARSLVGLRSIWLSTVAFLPLYAAVGAILVRTWPPRDPAVLVGLTPALAGLGGVLAALSIALRPLLRRAGVGYPAACLSSWFCAEGVVLCGLVLWVESGDVAGFAVSAVVGGALLAALLPTAAGLRRHERTEAGQ